MLHLTTRDSFHTFADALRDRQSFKTGGSLYGGPASDIIVSTGILPPAYLASARSADYLVYSYATPIAWHNEDTGWTVPDVKYSVTTSKQQGKIRAAVSVIEPLPVALF